MPRTFWRSTWSGGRPVPPRVLVIGVGNAYRRDDAVGLVAARRLWEAAGEQVILEEASGEGAALMESWDGADAVILFDAVCSGAPAGTIRRVDARAEALPPALFRHTTHAFSVAEAIELARTLNRLPPRLIVFGVEGRHFGAGLGLTPEVERAIDRLVQLGLQEIERAGVPRDGSR